MFVACFFLLHAVVQGLERSTRKKKVCNCRQSRRRRVQKGMMNLSCLIVNEAILSSAFDPVSKSSGLSGGFTSRKANDKWIIPQHVCISPGEVFSPRYARGLACEIAVLRSRPEWSFKIFVS